MNLIENAKAQAAQVITAAYQSAAEAGVLPQAELPAIVVSIPKDTKNGDFASSFAMQCAKPLRMAPRKIAEAIVENISLDDTYFESISIAGPGFLNFVLGQKWYADAVALVAEMGDNYGRLTAEKPEKIMIEFVSANPTGPMHMGNARGGVLGDCLAEVLSWAGHDVTREFYINDAGNQVDKFAKSVEGRYRQIIFGEDAVDFDESWYQGGDIKELAAQLYEMHGKTLLDMDDAERTDTIVTYGLKQNIAGIQRDLGRYKINYDVWFHESTLHETGFVADTVELLRKAGVVYEQDGAVWLRSTDFGCDKDDVLQRANGFYTYFAADIAYHRNKFAERGFDRVINIWGADHHGHVKRLQSALDAIGLDGSNRLEIILMQLVRMMQNGEVVRMSKRTGKSLTLSDLLDEMPVDAARFFFNSRAADTHLEFDMDLAIRQDSENPLYYVQYAHARICSMLRKLAEEGVAIPDSADLTVLTEGEEHALIKAVSQLPEEIAQAAVARDPSRLNKYAVALSAQFHRFYNACRIKDAEPAVRDARIVLSRAVRQTIENVLKILGVEAPEHM
ncbi:MAG: arginine--tRNA ligase [Butyricicoccaceae bacterium]